SNQGTFSLCGSRIDVEQIIYEKFKDAFLKRVSTLKVGDPLNDESRMGAIVSKPHLEKVLSYSELAKQEGGKILCGGNQLHLEGKNANGYFIEATVIENLPYD